LARRLFAHSASPLEISVEVQSAWIHSSLVRFGLHSVASALAAACPAVVPGPQRESIGWLAWTRPLQRFSSNDISFSSACSHLSLGGFGSRRSQMSAIVCTEANVHELFTQSTSYCV